MVTTKGINNLENFCTNPPAGWRIIYVDETTSTNSLAMEEGLQGGVAQTIVVANQQTGGRGRLGKVWESHAGCGLYVSIILRPQLNIEHLSRITLAAGVALADTAVRCCRVESWLKWPNDLLVKGQKCGGILAESDVRNSRSPLVILGIGVNIHSPAGGYSPDLRVKAGSLNDFSDGCRRVDFLKMLIPTVVSGVAELEIGEFKGILNRWRKYDYTKGKQLTWLTAGGQVIEGVCDGINDDGLLFITDGSGKTHKVLSGDVQLSPSGSL